ncbi:MAG: DUF1059 domain-containing protein [Solirubrobacteraceae bacterium]
MDRTLQCDCGFTARAEDEDGLVAEVQRHAYEAHRMTLSHDDAVMLAFRAELEAIPLPATKPATPTNKEER